jgi:autophagy-related protein 11
VEAVKKHANEAEILERALGVAISNLGTHVGSLQMNHTEAQKWAAEVLNEQDKSVENWESALTRLGKIPIEENLLRFIRQKNPSSARNRENGSSNTNPAKTRSLRDIFDQEEVKLAVGLSRTATNQFEQKLVEIDRTVERILQNSHDLSANVSKSVEASASETQKKAEELLVEVEALAQKVSSDYEHVLGLDQISSKSVPQASKLALLHTRNFLVNLSDHSTEMGEYFRMIIEQRNALAMSSAKHLQTISSIESMMAQINPRLSALALGDEAAGALQLLTLLRDIPLAYGSFLVEAVRRREWADKLKTDSSSLAEELAVLKDEEERRRRRWLRSTGELIWREHTESQTLGVEINLKGDEDVWPTIIRDQVQSYIAVLRNTPALDNTIGELTQLFKDLDKPSKQQAKRIKAFKMGSVHDVSLGRNSMLLRPEEEAISRTLKDENTKLEERLKGSESRVRKLEDLLHRSSTMGRNGSGNIFQSVESSTQDKDAVPKSSHTAAAQPMVRERSSGQSSLSRRISANIGSDEKTLIQRILKLEANLIAERDISSKLQKEANARRNSEDEANDRIQEANSTKNDLLKNLEAQQLEFVEERKLIEDELRTVKARLEDADDDMDRILGSREHEKTGFQMELDQARKISKAEQDRNHKQIAALRNDMGQFQGEFEQIDEQRRRAVEENSLLSTKVADLEGRLLETEDGRFEKIKSLQSAHFQLAPGQQAPQDISLLVRAIELLAEKSTNYTKSLESALAMARADREALESTMHETEAEAAATKEKLDVEEMESFQLRETLATERGKISALQAELECHQSELSDLRATFAKGETGSQSLKTQLTEYTARVDDLSEKLATKGAQSQVLEGELQRLREKVDVSREEYNKSNGRHESRAGRARELSRRLYAQNERLSRLLESLGFAITRLDDSMVIQRASKVNTTSTTEADPTSAMRRSLSGSMTMRQALESSIDMDLVSWMTADTGELEAAKYESYLNAISKFDLDVFSEVITKRVKDMESMARKWQRETRAYRDRAHRSQHESHEKISYRSFKEGDLALFLPTRNQATKAWAAFNVGAPHYFLREQETHRLQARDWLLARIHKVEERVVDLKKSMADLNLPAGGDRQSIASSDGASFMDDENPFELSDGLRWYLLDAVEEKPGAPTTPGLGKSKSTVASANVDVKGSIGIKKPANGSGASKTLSKSLDSRRSSTNSRKGSTASPLYNTAVNNAVIAEASRGSPLATAPHESQAIEAVRGLDLGLGIGSDEAPARDREVRRDDLLWGP